MVAEDELLKRLPCIQTWVSRRPELLSSWLLRATEHGQAQVVRYLLANGADVNSRFWFIGPPLTIAIRKNLYEMAQSLIEHPDIQIDSELQEAAGLGNISMVVLLLGSNKCDIHDITSSSRAQPDIYVQVQLWNCYCLSQA